MIRISRYMYISHLLTLMVTRELAVCFDQYKLITCIYFTISVIINPLCLAPKVMVRKKSILTLAIYIAVKEFWSFFLVFLTSYGLLKYFQACCHILILHCSYTDSVKILIRQKRKHRQHWRGNTFYNHACRATTKINW